MGAVQPLVDLCGLEGAASECRTYACLALANLSATITNHTVTHRHKDRRTERLPRRPFVASSFF